MFFQRLYYSMSDSWGRAFKRTCMRTATSRIPASTDEFCMESRSWRHNQAFSTPNWWDECSRSWGGDSWQSRSGIEEMRLREENMRRMKK